MPNKKTLVIGASTNPERYSYKAIKSLLNHHHSVVAIGAKDAVLDTVQISKHLEPHTNIDTITLYVNPIIQQKYYDYILSLNPKRVIFNPGTENDELELLCQSNNIETLEACTLVLLSIGSY